MTAPDAGAKIPSVNREREREREQDGFQLNMGDLMRGMVAALICCLTLVACGGGNPYLDASLKPAELQGKDKAWFEKHWGVPDGKAARFFGGETWTYYRIAGGRSGLPLFNFSPNECQITLKFDKEDKLTDYSYSGC